MSQIFYSIITVMDDQDVRDFGCQMLESYDDVGGTANSEYFAGFERGQLLLLRMDHSSIDELGLVCVEHIFMEVDSDHYEYEDFALLPVDPDSLRIVREKNHDSW